MNVLFISQCNKRALTETRRILDQFAERRGARTWQTPITQAGLATVRKLLRASARKNTAVACHWIRGRDHSELLWIVGNARQFNTEGAVPTNTTQRDVLRGGDENDWHDLPAITALAQLAALMHDLGKASVAFQERLRGQRRERNLYRHEWVSLRLFLAFVGQGDDSDWLVRLADATQCDEALWTAAGRYQRDGLDDDISHTPFQGLCERAPLAAAIAWLIVTHHRLPVAPAQNKDGSQAPIGRRVRHFEPIWLENPLARLAHDWNEIHQPQPKSVVEPYWEPAGPLPVQEPSWRKQAARLASKLLALQSGSVDSWLDQPYVMHLARMALMLADHHYSSLPPDAPGRVRGDGRTRLYANTDPKTGQLKQPLDEHLLGVAQGAGQVAHALPGFERRLPRLANHRGLRRRSADTRFRWQDKAFDAAAAMRTDATERGAFIINMASTGCGKTLANARILYALAHPAAGLRATYALGLRTLTLQTGRSYQHDLHLKPDELAVHVGGSANRHLFNYYAQQATKHGSASTQSIIEEDSHVLYEGDTAGHPLLRRAMADPQIAKLISAPVLVCTVDHIVPATESLRGGRQIAPMLRLLSADLILDELDDYGLEDLPALTRLVHWAGLLGSRVLLSSATLPPALLRGMFLAYGAGRRQYQRHRGQQMLAADAAMPIPCLWADEFAVQRASCSHDQDFSQAHQDFLRQRTARLQEQPALRQGQLLPLAIATRDRERIRHAFADTIRQAILDLHATHAQTVPGSDQRASFGLVRMANIDPIFDVARVLHEQGAPEGTQIHLCVYHARFPLLQRSAIEHMLDTVFNRRDAQAVWQHAAVRRALQGAVRNHVFVVLASPVCEVGRDWDADWAVVEPSSLRSLIQLAGRVQRHRQTPCSQPNMVLLASKLRHFEQSDSRQPVFTRPGYEKAGMDGRFMLASHQLQDLLTENEYQRIDARPRIQPRPPEQWRPQHSLADLEQARTAAAMLPTVTATAAPRPSRRRAAAQAHPGLARDYAAAAWHHPQAMLTGVLAQQQPFREQALHQNTLVFLPDDEGEQLLPHRMEDDPAKRGQKLYVPAAEMLYLLDLQSAPGIRSWGNFDLATLLQEQAEALGQAPEEIAAKFTAVEIPESMQGWRWHPWLGFTGRR